MHLYKPTHISAMFPDYPKEVKKYCPPLQGPQLAYFLQYIHLLISPTLCSLVNNDNNATPYVPRYIDNLRQSKLR